MRKALVGLFAVGLAGCGYSDSSFINDYVDSDCEYAMECYDDAVLNFWGWDSASACEADRGPVVASWGLGCVFDKDAAKECVRQLKDRECPPAGQDHEVPSICDAVYSQCEDTDLPVDTGDTGVN